MKAVRPDIVKKLSRGRLPARLWIIFTFLIAVVFVCQGALADTPGCDPKVMDAMNAKAQAKVAYDVAVTEQIIKKPDSVLALTCFNQSVATDASVGGAIFSGSFNDDIKNIVPAALATYYNNFKDAPGNDGTTVDYSTNATNVDNTAISSNCSAIQDLWDKVQKNAIGQDTPYVSFDELMSGKLTADNEAKAGDTFKADWNASQGQFNTLNQAVNNLPKPNATNVSGDTPCAVQAKINAANKLPPPTGCP